MNPAPRMPNWSDADWTLRVRYDSFIVKVSEMNATNGIADFHQCGLQLARDLKLEAQKLGYSRAYEFSSDIYWLLQAAATVLFFLVGSQSTVFREYLKDVLYYRNFESTSARVKEFLAFTQCDA